MVHTFNPSALGAEAGGFCEFEAGLVYRARFRTVRATQKKTLSQKTKMQNHKEAVVLNLPNTAILCLHVVVTSHHRIISLHFRTVTLLLL